MFKVDRRSIRHCPGVFDVNFEYMRLVSSVFFSEFAYANAG